MKKFLFIAILALTGCAQEDITIKNECPESWVRIADGENRTEIARLEFGDRAYVGIKGQTDAYNRLVLTADFYSLISNQPMGSAVKTFTISSRDVSGIEQEAWTLRCPPKPRPQR